MATWHLGKVSTFCTLSSLDLFFTHRLIALSGGQVYESNPIAHAWLSNHGWAGLAFFKICMVTVVIAASLLVSRSNPRAGGRVLAFACLMVGCVVGYSFRMGGSAELMHNLATSNHTNLLVSEPQPHVEKAFHPGEMLVLSR